MSHFTVIKTQISDIEGLVKALDDSGFKQVEIYAEAQNLYGYTGDKRSQTAEVIIRRKYVGEASNDIGFKRQPDGVFEAIISAYDRHKYSSAWLEQLTQRYSYHVAKAKLTAQGFDLVTEEKQTDGRIHLVARRTV